MLQVLYLYWRKHQLRYVATAVYRYIKWSLAEFQYERWLFSFLLWFCFLPPITWLRVFILLNMTNQILPWSLQAHHYVAQMEPYSKLFLQLPKAPHQSLQHFLLCPLFKIHDWITLQALSILPDQQGYFTFFSLFSSLHPPPPLYAIPHPSSPVFVSRDSPL